MEPQLHVRKAIEATGTAVALAKLIDVSPSAITQWCLPKEDKFYRQVPFERCLLIEATNGLVRCEDLRPDVRWDVLRNSKEVQEASAQQGH